MKKKKKVKIPAYPNVLGYVTLQQVFIYCILKFHGFLSFCCYTGSNPKRRAEPERARVRQLTTAGRDGEETTHRDTTSLHRLEGTTGRQRKTSHPASSGCKLIF
jgi:hypothetical protein